MNQLIGYITRGGPVMYVLLVCSIVGLALFLQRMKALQRERILPEEATARALTALERGDRTAAISAVNDNTGVGRLLRHAVEHVDLPEAELREEMEQAGRRELATMERYTGALATLATTAPLIGLLGTILGMIQTFQGMQEAASSSSATGMADGMWQALLTTAAGLLVAIPCLLGHRYLMARIDGFVLELESTSSRIIRLLLRHRDPASGDAP